MSLFGFLEKRGAGGLENPSIPITPMQLDGLFGYTPTASGISINEKTALTFAAYYAAVKIVAESIASMRLRIIKVSGNARVNQPSNPIARLLAHRPNPEMTATVFWETIFHHVVGWGNGYARIILNGAGQPAELWPLDPSQTKPQRQNGVLTFRSGSDIFQPHEIVHIPGLGFDGLVGYSPIALHRETIGAGIAGQRSLASFYGNGQQISGVLEYPGMLSPEALNNLRNAWAKDHSGTGNAWKPAILESGVTWKPTGMTLQDAQYIATMMFTVSDISRIFRIPAYMLGDASKTTNSNMETLGSEFATYTLAPYMRKSEQEIGFKLLTDSNDLEVSWDDSSIIRGDSASRQTYYASGRQWGWLSANDCRALEGLNPLGPEGDQYLSPVNMWNAMQALEAKPVPIPPKAPVPELADPGSLPALPASPAPAAAKTALPSAKTKKVFARLFADVVERFGRKETAVCQRAQERKMATAAVEKWRDEFLAEHSGKVAESFRELFLAMAEASSPDDGLDSVLAVRAESTARQATESYISALREVIDTAPANELGERVRSFAQNSPARYAVILTEMNI